MLAVLFVILNLFANSAQAQTICSPANAGTKEKNIVVCGDERVPSYTQKDQKVQTLTLLFENDQQGFERRVVVKNPGLTVTQINDGALSASTKVKQEIEKIKKEWELKEVKTQIASFTFDKKAPLFAAADMKTKLNAAKISTKIQRSVASETIMAGGVRGAKDKKSK